MSEKNQDAELRTRQNGQTWLFISMVLSVIIIGWGFSIPFRNNSSLVTTDRVTPETTDDFKSKAAEFAHKRSQAESFRQNSLDIDAEFMRQRAAKAELPEVPGKKHAADSWGMRVKKIHRELKALGNPPKPSIQWQEKQRLLEALKDGPGES